MRNEEVISSDKVYFDNKANRFGIENLKSVDCKVLENYYVDE